LIPNRNVTLTVPKLTQVGKQSMLRLRENIIEGTRQIGPVSSV